MQNKKGVAEAVDWIVAGAIFLIYISLVFIFFKPGVSEVFDDQTLSNIVQTNLMESIEWQIIQSPLFLEINKKSIGDSTQKVVAENKYNVVLLDIDKQFEFPITLVKNPETGNPWHVPDFKKTSIYFVPSLKEDLDKLYQDSYVISNKDLLIEDLKLSKSKKTKILVFISSDNFTENHAEFETKTSDIKACNSKQEEIDMCSLIYTAGSSEILKGISNINFNKLKEEDYDQLKEQWNFPINKDFKVVVYGGKKRVDNKEIELTFEVAKKESNVGILEPHETANVYVREFNTYLLNEDGGLEAKTVNIRVW